jgi:hypothetical protein
MCLNTFIKIFSCSFSSFIGVKIAYRSLSLKGGYVGLVAPLIDPIETAYVAVHDRVTSALEAVFMIRSNVKKTIKQLKQILFLLFFCNKLFIAYASLF